MSKKKTPKRRNAVALDALTRKAGAHKSRYPYDLSPEDAFREYREEYVDDATAWELEQIFQDHEDRNE